MSWHLVLAVVLSSFCFSPSSFAAAPEGESCECAQSSCGPCEVDTGTTFYSAKCGPQNSRVKSCKRATCEPVEDQKQCLAVMKNAPPVELKGAGEPATARQVANLAAEAGQITELQGDFSVTHSNGISEKPRKRDPAFVGDVFETRGESLVKIVLRDGSEVAVAPNSRLRIDKVDVSESDSALKRQVAMMVLAGKVRNRVTKNYKGENTYQVRTPSAVAGVRGTDFITSYMQGENGWVSEVRTIEGLVRLSSNEVSSSAVVKHVDIPAGTFAVFKEGELSPLFKMKEEDHRQLQIQDFIADARSGAGVKRSVASVEESAVCAAPAGGYNQCSYSCENNPAGEKRCRTDLPDVACVRRICRANGQWAEQKRLPASEFGRCEPKGSVVGDCGSYW